MGRKNENWDHKTHLFQTIISTSIFYLNSLFKDALALKLGNKNETNLKAEF